MKIRIFDKYHIFWKIKKSVLYRKSVKTTNPSATIVIIVPAIIEKTFLPLSGFVYCCCVMN